MRKITVWLLALSLSMGSTLDVCRAQTVLTFSGATTNGGGGGKPNTWSSTGTATIAYTIGGSGGKGGTQKTASTPTTVVTGESCLITANNAIAAVTVSTNTLIASLNLSQADQQKIASEEQAQFDTLLKPCE